MLGKSIQQVLLKALTRDGKATDEGGVGVMPLSRLINDERGAKRQRDEREQPDHHPDFQTGRH